LPGAGFGIHRELVKKLHQSSCGIIGAASQKMKTKIATIPIMLLQPQIQISHSIGFSSQSRTPVFRDETGVGADTV
jgi:hypothetical protein